MAAAIDASAATIAFNSAEIAFSSDSMTGVMGLDPASTALLDPPLGLDKDEVVLLGDDEKRDARRLIALTIVCIDETRFNTVVDSRRCD